MVWTEISLFEKTELCFIYSKMNSVVHEIVLENRLLPLAYHDYGTTREVFEFMADNAPGHTSSHTKNLLKECDMKIWTGLQYFQAVILLKIFGVLWQELSTVPRSSAVL